MRTRHVETVKIQKEGRRILISTSGALHIEGREALRTRSICDFSTCWISASYLHRAELSVKQINRPLQSYYSGAVGTDSIEPDFIGTRYECARPRLADPRRGPVDDVAISSLRSRGEINNQSKLGQHPRSAAFYV